MIGAFNIKFRAASQKSGCRSVERMFDMCPWDEHRTVFIVVQVQSYSIKVLDITVCCIYVGLSTSAEAESQVQKTTNRSRAFG